jgi:hypothetical protein
MNRIDPQVMAKHAEIDRLFEAFFAAGPLSEEECERHMAGITKELQTLVALAALQEGEA